MIYEALSLIQSELEVYIQGINSSGDVPQVTLGNVALLESENASFENGILVSLVNVEEESALKNTNGFNRLNKDLRYVNPPISLNLYILFSSHWPVGNYDQAMRGLSWVIEFFQGSNIFNIKNSPYGAQALAPSEEIGDGEIESENLLEFRLILDMYTLTFEQINHLWGSLGGKQIPFVMYKGRLVQLFSDRALKDGQIIERTRNNPGIIE